MVDVGVPVWMEFLVEVEAPLFELSCFESEKSGLNRPGFHSYQVFPLYRPSGLGVLVHYRRGASGREAQVGARSSRAYWDFCVSREDQVDTSEQLGLVQRHSRLVNPNDA